MFLSNHLSNGILGLEWAKKRQFPGFLGFSLFPRAYHMPCLHSRVFSCFRLWLLVRKLWKTKLPVN